jgi:hypothetical protein
MLKRHPLLLILIVVALAAGLTKRETRAQNDAQRAGLVVHYSDGSVVRACIAFGEDEISGLELLERSGLPIVTQSGGIGAAVCKIGPDGCDYPSEACFCERSGSRSIYWAFYTLDAGEWRYASLGAANVPVRDGDVHGWAWGAGDSRSGALPPTINFTAVCAAPTATATLLQVQVTATTALPAPTESTLPTATPALATSAPTNYLAFGAMAGLLLLAIVVVLLRR